MPSQNKPHSHEKKYHAYLHISFLTRSIMWGAECEPCAMCDMTRKVIICKKVLSRNKLI